MYYEGKAPSLLEVMSMFVKVARALITAKAVDNRYILLFRSISMGQAGPRLRTAFPAQL